jgi:hypothetical protein
MCKTVINAGISMFIIIIINNTVIIAIVIIIMLLYFYVYTALLVNGSFNNRCT